MICNKLQKAFLGVLRILNVAISLNITKIEVFIEINKLNDNRV